MSTFVPVFVLVPHSELWLIISLLLLRRLTPLYNSPCAILRRRSKACSSRPGSCPLSSSAWLSSQRSLLLVGLHSRIVVHPHSNPFQPKATSDAPQGSRLQGNPIQRALLVSHSLIVPDADQPPKPKRHRGRTLRQARRRLSSNLEPCPLAHLHSMPSSQLHDSALSSASCEHTSLSALRQKTLILGVSPRRDPVENENDSILRIFCAGLSPRSAEAIIVLSFLLASGINTSSSRLASTSCTLVKGIVYDSVFVCYGSISTFRT